uniref:Transmembrane channel-like protein n=1 Tax=Sinocyclocheilus rhinocerous TaxID=307959 RepID=A0A673KF89_9TELE
DWASPPEGAEDSNEPRNLRELPLHMGLKKAVWYTCLFFLHKFTRVNFYIFTLPTSRDTFELKKRKTILSVLTSAPKSFACFRCLLPGHFGGGVQSYFLFLRFLVILNFLSSLLIGAFVLIPSIVFRSMNLNSTIAHTVNLTGRNTISLDIAEVLRAVGGYSMLVFTGWDHGLQGDRATKLKQNNLRHRLQVCAASLTLGQTVSLYALRVFLNLVVLILIGAAFYGIAQATQFSQVRLLLQYLPSMVITASNFVVPLLCDKIALLEKYSPNSSSACLILLILSVGCCRAVFLRLVSLGCWETRVGQEMYKLTLFDFLITIATLILVEFPHRIVVDHCSCKLTKLVGRQEFLVPPNVLALVYSQTVVWTGALFCPLLPFINTIKFILFYYCKKITLFQNCQPATRNFRSTTSNFFFLLVLIHPSYGCGPFRLNSAMWDVVPGAVKMLSHTSKEFLFYIGSQKFSIPLFIFSCVLLCYVSALTSVHGKSVTLLKSQCKLVNS